MRIWKRYENPATTAEHNKSEQGATETTRGADSTARDTKTKNLGGLTVDAQANKREKGHTGTCRLSDIGNKVGDIIAR